MVKHVQYNITVSTFEGKGLSFCLPQNPRLEDNTDKKYLAQVNF